MSSSPPLIPKNWSTIILSFITSIFSIAGFAFAQKITQNLLLEILITCAFGIGSLFVTLITGIASKISQQLEEIWAKRIADWLDMRILAILSGYRRHYLRSLLDQHRNFDTKGLTTLGEYTFDLEEVFVELSIAPIPPHEASADPLKIPDALRTGQRFIWEYLTATDKHLVIIGAPGSGKTTLLQHVVLACVNRKGHKRTIKLSYKMPFLLFLRNYGNDIIETSGFSLVNAIHKQIDKMGWSPPPSGWVERQLNGGRCLILLDGLDELAEAETRRETSDWIQRQLLIYGKNRFIVTARPYGYRSNPLQGVWVLEVKGFSQNQIERFVNNWYLADEKKRTQRDDSGVSSNAKAEAADLLQRIRHANALSKLAVNPLLLTMIATVHQYRGALPDNRVTLYEEMCEVLLGKRQAARGVKSEFSPAQKQSVLRPLAYYMMLKGKREIALSDAYEAIKDPLALVSPQLTSEKFLKMIEEGSGLWVEREPEVYGFTHMTFQIPSCKNVQSTFIIGVTIV
jgi:predicted NACHT family NTPase